MTNKSNSTVIRPSAPTTVKTNQPQPQPQAEKPTYTVMTDIVDAVLTTSFTRESLTKIGLEMPKNDPSSPVRVYNRENKMLFEVGAVARGKALFMTGGYTLVKKIVGTKNDEGGNPIFYFLIQAPNFKRYLVRFENAAGKWVTYQGYEARWISKDQKPLFEADGYSYFSWNGNVGYINKYAVLGALLAGYGIDWGDVTLNEAEALQKDDVKRASALKILSGIGIISKEKKHFSFFDLYALPETTIEPIEARKAWQDKVRAAQKNVRRMFSLYDWYKYSFYAELSYKSGIGRVVNPLVARLAAEMKNHDYKWSGICLAANGAVMPAPNGTVMTFPEIHKGMKAEQIKSVLSVFNPFGEDYEYKSVKQFYTDWEALMAEYEVEPYSKKS
jgi:hypothetical protein